MTTEEALAKLAETGTSTPDMTEALYLAGYIEHAPLNARGWAWTDRGLAVYREKRGVK